MKLQYGSYVQTITGSTEFKAFAVSFFNTNILQGYMIKKSEKGETEVEIADKNVWSRKVSTVK